MKKRGVRNWPIQIGTTAKDMAKKTSRHYKMKAHGTLTLAAVSNMKDEALCIAIAFYAIITLTMGILMVITR